MGGSCSDDQFWDALVKRCIGCHTVCKQPHVNPRCTSSCESAYCKALPGHYYDGLLKKCVRCAEVCGGPPAECYQHCQKISFQSITKAPPPPVTTKKPLVEVTSHTPNFRGTSGPTTLEDSTILLYSLLGLCMVLLITSLFLALAVLVRKTWTKTFNPGPKEANYNQESVAQLAEEVGRPGQSSKGFVTNSSSTTDREPSYDSSPTETCVCVHCFPDLKALGQGNDRIPRAPFSFYQQPVFHRAQMQKGGPVWTEENVHTFGLQVQEEVVVG